MDETQEAPNDAPDETTDLPGFVTWPSVYLLVVAVTVVYIVLLVVLEKVYS